MMPSIRHVRDIEQSRAQSHAPTECAANVRPRPESSIPERGMLLDQLTEPLGPRGVSYPGAARWDFRSMQARSTHAEDVAAPSFRDTRQRGSHASDVFRSKG